MFFMSGALLSGFLLLVLVLIPEIQEASSQTLTYGTFSDDGVIIVGSTLSTGANSSWLSPSGRFAFGFYPEAEGFLVGIQLLVSPLITRVVWTARLDLKPFSKDAFINFTSQGFLLTPKRGAPPLTLFNLTSQATSAAMLDNGNFVIYSSNSSFVSQKSNVSLLSAVVAPSGGSTSALKPGIPYSRGCSKVYPCNSDSIPRTYNGANSSNITWRSFDYPTDTILGDQFLPCGHNLTSAANNKNHSVGVHVLSMQCDGNLVFYSINPETATWDSGTSGETYRELVLNDNGRLFLRTSTGTGKDLSGYKAQNVTADIIYAATLDADGVFRLYAVNLVTNSSHAVNEIPYIKDPCQAKGVCGANSYCSLVNSVPTCKCIPGFEDIHGRDVATECQSIRALPSCRMGSGAFSMALANNIAGLDELAYSIVSTADSENCSRECVDDCDCYAAVFREQKCFKLKLPLTGGTKDTNDPGVAFVKMAVEAGDSGDGSAERKRQVRVLAIMVCVIVAGIIWLAIIAACGGAYWLLFGSFREKWGKWELAFKEEIAPRSFSYDEIPPLPKEKNLGAGAHGKVYSADLKIGGEPVTVAVKRLHGADANVEKDFKAEIRLIGRARHVNVVRILGFCHDHDNLLVYEYMLRRSLEEHIFNAPEQRPKWDRLVKLLLGAARGIHYLHRECEETIIHRDIKPGNILISANWTAKISDFGLAKHISANEKVAVTKEAGTVGYMAPECGQGTITEKVDVYSYGVVVLETVCGKREGTLDKLVEASKIPAVQQDEQVEASVLDKVVNVGISCVREDPGARPSMEEVVMVLEEVTILMDVPKPWPLPFLGQPSSPSHEQLLPLLGSDRS